MRDVRDCCTGSFEADRPAGKTETISFTIGHCARCAGKLLHVRTPYGPTHGTVHALSEEKHAQLMEGTDVDLELFREKWLRQA